MVFDKYYERWNKHGFELPVGIEITKEILDQVNGQNAVCDLIWAINVANQSNKSVANLSYTVMDQIRKLSPLLLNHKSFKPPKYSFADDVEERAVRHFRDDANMGFDSFERRKTTIRNIIEVYINKVKR